MKTRAAKIHYGRWFVFGIAAGVAIGLSRRRPRYSFRNRVAVITGGSRGLGLVLARTLADEGARVVLLARSTEELERAERDLRRRGATVVGLACDIRQQSQVNSAIEEVMTHFGRIDVLINNAGVIQVGPMEHMTLTDFEDALAVHLYGPLFTALAVLPHMREAGGGRIVNISSMGGKVAVPHLLPYVASKFALSGLSEALYTELRKDGISVTTVYPSLMRTGSPVNALFKGKHRREYAWFSVLDSLPLLSMSAERAARKIAEACRRGSPRLALGIKSKAAILMNDLMPGLTARLLAGINRALPSRGEAADISIHTGAESQSAVAPSFVTTLSERAASENNERGA